jgi:N-acetylneuraminic acid mutarotase
VFSFNFDKSEKKMRKILLLFFYVIAICQIAIGQDPWIQKTCMFNYGRHVAICFTINNKAYVGLGAIHDGTRLSDFWEYNPLTNKWLKKADYPGGGRYAATAFAINGKGYICLGIDEDGNNTNDLWEYNPDSDTWLRKANFPDLARYGASCFVIGDTAFIGTGSFGVAQEYLFDLWMYVPRTNKWSKKADFPGYKRCHASAFSIGNFGFMGSGLLDNNTPTKDFWKYNPQTDSWTRCADLPDQPRLGCISFVINRNGYLGLGFDQKKDYNNFYKYDPVIDSWMEIVTDNNIIERRGSVGFSIGTVGYFATGETKNGLMPDLWAFNSGEENNNPGSVIEDEYFSIFPNPAVEEINIVSSTSLRGKILSVFNSVGQEVLRLQVTKRKEIIDISKFAVGTYLVKIRDQKKIKAIKFIKGIG